MDSYVLTSCWVFPVQINSVEAVGAHEPHQVCNELPPIRCGARHVAERLLIWSGYGVFIVSICSRAPH